MGDTFFDKLKKDETFFKITRRGDKPLSFTLNINGRREKLE